MEASRLLHVCPKRSLHAQSTVQSLLKTCVDYTTAVPNNVGCKRGGGGGGELALHFLHLDLPMCVVLVKVWFSSGKTGHICTMCS